MKSVNAIILAAGGATDKISNDFDIPKPLYKVNGESLIERLIKQLHEKNIVDITVVVGYKKEQLLYLEDKYKVNLIVNKNFAKTGSIYSLYLAKENLYNTFVCYCDNYFEDNPFTILDHSYALTCNRNSKNEFRVSLDNNYYIKSISVVNLGSLCLPGLCFLTSEFSNQFKSLLSSQIDLLGTKSLFIEEFISRNIESLKLKSHIVESSLIKEFDTIFDLNDYSKNFVDSLPTDVITNICTNLKCDPSDISSTEIIAKGLTNVSFKFTVKEKEYIYRYPGNTSSRFANRESEFFAQSLAKREHIDDTFITMDVNRGWKLSNFVTGCYDFEYTNENQLSTALSLLKKLHDTKKKSPYDFNPFNEADRLLNEASFGNKAFIRRFENLRKDVRKLYLLTELEGVDKVVCHNDAYAVNFLTNDNGINIIDWEYSGNNDPYYDLGCIISRDNISDDLANHMLDLYLNHKASPNEYRHFCAYVAIAAWYWFAWCLCKNSIGDDFGWWYLNSFHSAKKYSQKALDLYGCN